MVFLIAQWYRAIGLAPLAERRSRNYLLNQLQAATFFARLATKMAVVEEMMPHAHHDKWSRATGSAANVA